MPLGHRLFLIRSLLAILLATAPQPSRAATLCADPSPYQIDIGDLTGDSPAPAICGAAGFYCEKTQTSGPAIELADPACDPEAGPCTVQIRVPLEFPGHEQNLAISSGAPKPIVYYFNTASPPPCTPSFPFNDCGAIAICGQIGGPQFLSDVGETLIRRGGVTCDNVESIADVLSLSVFTCLTSSSCRKRLDVSGLAFGGEAVGQAIGCPVPPPVQSCRRGGGTSCRDCPAPT